MVTTATTTKVSRPLQALSRGQLRRDDVDALVKGLHKVREVFS